MIEHEAFPFAVFKSVSNTTHDALPSLKCIDGKAKIRIYEGLDEKTFLDDFQAYAVKKQEGLTKPDLSGKPRVIKEEKLILLYMDRLFDL